MKSVLLGIDIGTSACKVAAFDPDGTVLAHAAAPYALYHPAPGHVEQDPNEWWAAVCHAIRQTLASGNLDPRQIAGVGVDGQSWSAIPLDAAGCVLHNSPIWMDTRAAEIAARVEREVGAERLFQVAGNPFNATYSTPKILWFKEKHPDLYRRATVFLQSNSFIVHRLTNVLTQDLSQGYGLHMFNMATGRYDDALCDALGIAQEKLPPLFSCHAVVGEVTRAAAEMTGLAPGTPVVAGGLDAGCGTLGAGVVAAGQTQEQGGQAGGMSICQNRPRSHRKLILSQHVVPNLWLLQGGTVGGGGSLRWFHQEFGAFADLKSAETGASPLAIIDAEASAVAPGADGLLFLPYLAGERSPLWDKDAQGVLFGLGFNKTRGHVARAILEGSAYALRHNLETAEEVGATVTAMNAMGGAANSRLWTQIKADVTGKRIHVPASDTATTLGAAILAGVGTGVYPDFPAAVRRTVRLTRTHEPDPAVAGRYAAAYAIYRELYETSKQTMGRLSRFNEESI